MKKKAVLISTVIDFMLVVLTLVGFSVAIWATSGGAGIWADFYAKKISYIINYAEPGQNITLNFHDATKIAEKNSIDISEIFSVNNPENKVCIKLSSGRKTCYKYFNEVDVVNYRIIPASGPDGETNVLSFNIVETQMEKVQNE